MPPLVGPGDGGNCVYVSKGFFESPASPESVWRVYLKTWVPGHLCAGEKWPARLEQLAIDGKVPKAVLVEVLSSHLRDAGLRLMPFRLPERRDWMDLETDEMIMFCVLSNDPINSGINRLQSRKCVISNYLIDFVIHRLTKPNIIAYLFSKPLESASYFNSSCSDVGNMSSDEGNMAYVDRK